MSSYDIEIGIGDLFSKLAIPRTGRFSVDRQPAGLNFHEVTWKPTAPGAVMFLHRQHSFGIDHVLSVMATEDVSSPGRGLFSLSLNSGVSGADFVNHDEARKLFYGIIRVVSSKGWKSVVERSSPRLQGEARFKYALADDYLDGLDAFYEPTLEQWMRINRGASWPFYADGVFLRISLQRDADHMDPQKPGVYLLSFDFESAAEYFKAYAPPEHRDRWRELLPAELARAAKERARKEAELKALGVTIDETYVDPPVPAMK